MKRTDDGDLIVLAERDAVRVRRPLLVAHRGGVIDENAPENSLRAIALAAAHGYDMVELDLMRSTDGEPFVFHATGGRNALEVACGSDLDVFTVTLEQVTRHRYKASDQHIATLEDALDACATLKLGVMVDVKVPEDQLDRAFLDRVNGLLREYGLVEATCTITRSPQAREMLDGKILRTLFEEHVQKAQSGRDVDLSGFFWFGEPYHLPSALVEPLQARGALVLPAVNTFRYPPHAHMQLVRDDVRRMMRAGADGFQLDSVYEGLVKDAAASADG